MARNLISNPENSGEWSNNIKQYETNKKHLEWGTNPHPNTISNKVMKERDNLFNPILQVYNNKEYESHLRNKEQHDLINTLAKNKVHSIVT